MRPGTKLYEKRFAQVYNQFPRTLLFYFSPLAINIAHFPNKAIDNWIDVGSHP